MTATELINELERISIKAEHKDLGHIRLIASEAATILREQQDKLDIETAYNEVHIERIKALKSALNDILDNDGSRRIYSAGGLFDARLEAEALLASIEDVDGFDTIQEHVEETGNNRHVFDWVRLPDAPDA